MVKPKKRINPRPRLWSLGFNFQLGLRKTIKNHQKTIKNHQKTIKKTITKPYRNHQKPSKNHQKPSKTITKPYKNHQKPSKTIKNHQKPSARDRPEAGQGQARDKPKTKHFWGLGAFSTFFHSVLEQPPTWDSKAFQNLFSAFPLRF